MYNSILIGIKQDQFNRYSQAFNFFQSKSINNIIRSQKVDYVIHYRDLEVYDDQTQYFKRYYSTKETNSRIQKLINYYELNMTPPTPILILINTFAILQTRKKKHMKLVIMKEKSIARRAERGPQDQEADNSKNMILWELNGSKFSDITSEKEENDDRESFDSEPYYAFDDGEQQLRITGNPKIKEINLFNFKEVLDSLIIVDFNGHVEQRPMINVLPPVAEPPKPLVVRKVSREVQTIPVKVIDPNQIIQKKAEVQKQVQIPKLNREPQLGFKSDLGKKNILLTESIESAHRKEQKQKTKANTFMDYYNSQPVKASSNILEKYIKRKK